MADYLKLLASLACFDWTFYAVMNFKWMQHCQNALAPIFIGIFSSFCLHFKIFEIKFFYFIRGKKKEFLTKRQEQLEQHPWEVKDEFKQKIRKNKREEKKRVGSFFTQTKHDAFLFLPKKKDRHQNWQMKTTVKIEVDLVFKDSPCKSMTLTSKFFSMKKCTLKFFFSRKVAGCVPKPWYIFFLGEKCNRFKTEGNFVFFKLFLVLRNA